MVRTVSEAPPLFNFLLINFLWTAFLVIDYCKINHSFWHLSGLQITALKCISRTKLYFIIHFYHKYQGTNFQANNFSLNELFSKFIYHHIILMIKHREKKYPSSVSVVLFRIVLSSNFSKTYTKLCQICVLIPDLF